MSLERDNTAGHCPLCGQNNFCGNLSPNLSPNKKGDTCWCADDSIRFPESLISQVSDADKNKACICKTCALKHT